MYHLIGISLKIKFPETDIDDNRILADSLQKWVKENYPHADITRVDSYISGKLANELELSVS